MALHRFIADSAADAVAQVRQTLGADAVVVDVRRPQVSGLARLWQRPRIEVLAQVPEQPQLAPLPQDLFAELRRELRENQRKPEPRPVESLRASPAPAMPRAEPRSSEMSWRMPALLEQAGLMSVYVQRVFENVRHEYGETAPSTIAQEIEWACDALRRHWVAPPASSATAHLFVGPPGSGKTTCLSKWLAQTVLVEERPAVVYRLDAHVANTAESLTVLCEILGVPVERFLPINGWEGEDRVVFIDLPGVNPSDRDAFTSLEQELERMPAADMHLVLNLAYETEVLLGQARGFAGLPITDLIATHLDEEPRWGRLWNLVLGTGCSLRFLSAGQNIPGEFLAATPNKILARQFPQIHQGSMGFSRSEPAGSRSAQMTPP